MLLLAMQPELRQAPLLGPAHWAQQQVKAAAAGQLARQAARRHSSWTRRTTCGSWPRWVC